MLHGPRGGLALLVVASVACGSPKDHAAPTGSASTSAAPASVASSASSTVERAIPPVLATAAPVDYAALAARLRASVVDLPKQRDPGSPGWKAAGKACSVELRDAGFDVEEEAFDGGTNVIGTKPGTTGRESVVLSAHYDHFATCPGADDDGSGIAAVLEGARVLGKEPGDRTLVIACFDREEDGLVGSRAYAFRARARGDAIALAVSLDGVGYADSRPNSQQVPDGIGSVAPEVLEKLEARGRRADFIAAVADDEATSYVTLFDDAATRHGVGSIAIPLSSLSRILVADVNRSDHASFWLAGYSAMLVTDTADFRSPRYHCERGIDSADSLDYGFLARVTSTVIDLVRAARGPAR